MLLLQLIKNKFIRILISFIIFLFVTTPSGYAFSSSINYEEANSCYSSIDLKISVEIGSKITENNLAKFCKNGQDLVDYKTLAISSKAVATEGGSRVFEVGSYNTLKGVEAGLDAHHVGQRALMKKFLPGYNANTAPSILVPKQGHTLGSGVLSRGTSSFSNARQVLARDIFELRRVYPNVPNSSLQQLIQINKTMYPGAFIK